ncbi:AAA family ATPase [Patescibacteria group bacterium]|nr:AAA family ATPase [Patescibacteria group bacterium]
MSQVIAVVNQKGGVGKTTTSVNLSVFLAALGKFVLLIDLDPQANASSGLGIDHTNLERGIYEVLSGQNSFRDVVQNTVQDGLRIAPASISLAGAGVELVNVENRESRLHRALDEVRGAYDYILIDCPPSLGLLTINGLVAADKVLIPVQAEYYALEGLSALISTVNLVKDSVKPNLEILGAVLTMHDKRNKLSGEVMNELYKYFPDKIFRSIIPRTVRLAEAPSYGKSILHYDSTGKGAKAYERLARELLDYEG